MRAVLAGNLYSFRQLPVRQQTFHSTSVNVIDKDTTKVPLWVCMKPINPFV